MVLDRALGHAQRVGDLLVGEARGHQAQDLGLAVGQRIGAVKADEVVAHVFQARQQALGDGRLHQRAALGHGADGADQLLERDVLEQVALGARFQARQHQLVVVEGGQDDGWRQRVLPRKRLQRLQAGHHRHAHVHQHHVGLGLRDEFDRLLAVGGLGHHFDAVVEGQQRADALPHQCLIVHQTDADHVVASQSPEPGHPVGGTPAVQDAPSPAARTGARPDSVPATPARAVRRRRVMPPAPAARPRPCPAQRVRRAAGAGAG